MASEQEQLVTGIETYLRTTYGDTSAASRRKLFDNYDADGDGNIDKAELGKLLKDVDIGNTFTRGAWVRGIIDKLDANADGVISWDEFDAAVGAG